jgi:hypothetical protein
LSPENHQNEFYPPPNEPMDLIISTFNRFLSLSNKFSVSRKISFGFFYIIKKNFASPTS